MCISAYHYINVLPLLLPCIIILFLHLLSTNHKCTQPYYFLLLLKLVAQKMKKIWSTMIWSSRQTFVIDQFPVELWCLSATVF
jgi:hypothetical protein